jgi:dienelactone hydrolase
MAMAFAVVALAALGANAAVVTKTVDYQQGGATLEGTVAYDDASAAKRPGVLVVPQWMGPTDYEIGRAKQLAELGYVGLVADIYGKGVRPTTMEEASKLAASYKANRPLLRARAAAALATLRAQPLVDETRVAAIGYCFGGGTVLELARAGAALSGVVSFHGFLDTPNPADARNIRAPLLVMHGAEDPFVPPAQVAAFKREMDDARVSYQFIAYPGAVHAFTVKAAGNDPSKGMAYNAEADWKSWRQLKWFLERVLK